MQERSIDNALLALRKLTIREGREGLAQVEALLALRGVHMPAVLPAKRKDVAGKGLMALWIMESLQGGPKGIVEIVTYVASKRPEIDRNATYKRTNQALTKLKKRGLVVHDGRFGGLWGLAP